MLCYMLCFTVFRPRLCFKYLDISGSKSRQLRIICHIGHILLALLWFDSVQSMCIAEWHFNLLVLFAVDIARPTDCIDMSYTIYLDCRQTHWQHKYGSYPVCNSWWQTSGIDFAYMTIDIYYKEIKLVFIPIIIFVQREMQNK